MEIVNWLKDVLIKIPSLFTKRGVGNKTENSIGSHINGNAQTGNIHIESNATTGDIDNSVGRIEIKKKQI